MYKFCHSSMTIYVEERGDKVTEVEECEKCYGCCCMVYGEIVLKDGEARRIADYLEIPEIEFRERYVKNVANKDFFKIAKPCVFWTLGCCGINAVKPETCASYSPIIRKDKEGNPRLICGEWHKGKMQ